MKSAPVILALALGIGLSSLPASAGPFDIPNASNARHEAGAALRIHHVDHGWRVPPAWPSAIRVVLPVRETRNPWASLQEDSRLRMAAPRNLGVIAGIPEPSATVLFSVGLVLAVQTFPRRPTRGSTDAPS